MISITFVILSLILLYISKSKLSSEFSRLIHRFGGDRNILIVFWSAVFLPGTVVHEMSHFLFAILTGARTGKIEIFPRFLEEDWENEEKSTGVTLGYVQTQRLNPLQGFLVGTAPFIIGIVLLVWLTSSMQTSYQSASYFVLLLQGYLFFTISNSFFPSWSDIKQVIPLVVIMLITIVVSWLVGVKVVLSTSSQMVLVANTISSIIAVSVLLNSVIIIFLWLVRKTLSRRH